MNFTIQLNKSFEQAIKAIETSAEKHSFRVQHIHYVSDVLKEKGFEIDRYAIIELCNPKFAYAVLSKDKNFGAILPCKILLYEKEGKLFASAPKPVEMVEKLGMNEIKDIAQQVEQIIKDIMLEVEK